MVPLCRGVKKPAPLDLVTARLAAIPAAQRLPASGTREHSLGRFGSRGLRPQPAPKQGSRVFRLDVGQMASSFLLLKLRGRVSAARVEPLPRRGPCARGWLPGRPQCPGRKPESQVSSGPFEGQLAQKKLYGGHCVFSAAQAPRRDDRVPGVKVSGARPGNTAGVRSRLGRMPCVCRLGPGRRA